MSVITLKARRFRVLEAVDWTPDGVCLLAGPNGSGKTTALNALTFLRGVLMYGHDSAFKWVGGNHFRHLDAAEDEDVEFEIQVDDLRWILRFPMGATGLNGQYGEELYLGQERVFHADTYDDGWFLRGERRRIDDRRCCARVLLDAGEAEWMAPLERALFDLRVHYAYRLDLLRRSERAEGTDDYLHADGRNLWTVLLNWKLGAIRYGGSFDWVMQVARRAFPEIFNTLEFDRGFPLFYRPGDVDPAAGLPPRYQADGLLTGLCHLTTVAGAKAGSVVAIDEMENQLHPHAIRVILKAMREVAEERDLTIVLTTHSPVLMNAFKGREESFFVIEPGRGRSVPVALDDAYAPEWLDHFVLGDLYERSRIAAPRPVRG